MKLDLRQRSEGRPYAFIGGRHDGLEGNTLDCLYLTDGEELRDLLDELRDGYARTDLGNRRIVYKSQPFLRRALDQPT